MTAKQGIEDLSLQGIIFDLDGTLVDSRLDFTAIRAALNCPGNTGVLEFIDTLPEDQQDAAHQIVLDYERRGAECARWMPGAQDCLQRLATAGMPVGILTRNARAIAELTMERLDIHVDCLLAREDAAPKPSPDGLLAIARDWELPVSRLAYVGDFKFDLVAARNAGMTGVYYDPARSGQHVALADRVIHHFDELVRQDG